MSHRVTGWVSAILEAMGHPPATRRRGLDVDALRRAPCDRHTGEQEILFRVALLRLVEAQAEAGRRVALWRDGRRLVIRDEACRVAQQLDTVLVREGYSLRVFRGGRRLQREEAA